MTELQHHAQNHHDQGFSQIVEDTFIDKPVRFQEYDLLERRNKRRETSDPEVEEVAKELFKKGLEVASKIPEKSDKETLKAHENEILESTKFLVEAFLIDDKATEMSPRIMTLAQQYEKLLKLDLNDDINVKQDKMVEAKKSEKLYPPQDGHDNIEPEFTRESLILVIWLLFNGKQYPFCIQTLKIALSQLESKLHPRLFHLRASCYLATDDFKNCIKDLERLIMLNPNFVDAYSIQGSIQMSHGDRTDAVRNFKIYIEKANKDSTSYSHALYALSVLTGQNTTTGNRKVKQTLRNQQALNYYKKAKEAEERYKYLYGRIPDITEVKRTAIALFEQKGSKEIKVEKDSKKEAERLAPIFQKLLASPPNGEQQKRCKTCGSQTRQYVSGESESEKKKNLLICAGCSVANYCSKDCQKKDWKNGHKKDCAPLENMICNSLENHLYRNATFLAERLFAQDITNENSRFLLATCHYRSGQQKAAHTILNNAESINCKYLFARCCLDLDKAEEGKEKLLTIVSGLETRNPLDPFVDSKLNQTPDLASVLCLLGSLCKNARRLDDAAQYYVQCIKINPFMWEAFENLCQMGKSTQIDIDEIFKPKSEKVMSCRTPCSDKLYNSQIFISNPTHNGDRSTPDLVRRIPRPSSTTRHATQPLTSTPASDNREKKRSRTGNNDVSCGLGDENKLYRLGKDVRSFVNVENEVTEALQKATLDPDNSYDKMEDIVWKSNRNEVLELLQKIAEGYAYLNQYECLKAIKAFEELPESQCNTGWVQSHIGKAHFEMVNYSKAERCFQKARQLEPYRLEDMEIFSTTLWHLRKDTVLSALAHELVEFERLSPQAWCAVGNCFSRQQEHDLALKCFQRAIHLDPKFTYAHTLSGHESMANGNFEKAQEHFRNALNTNKRHYNALYGLANYYMTCDKKSKAEYHYKMAMGINPNHAVLMCCLGKVYEKMGKNEEARKLYDHACQVTPRTPLAIFKKAKSLYRDHYYEEALVELEKLKKMVRNEPKVYFLVGKIYKAMGDKTRALQNFTRTFNLDPKMTHIVKTTIEKLENDNEISMTSTSVMSDTNLEGESSMSDIINQAVLTANPNFAELYEHLKTLYLAPDGTTKALEKEIDQEDIIKERTEYLENLTLYNALQPLSLKVYLKNTMCKEKEKVLETLDKVISFSESKQYLNFRPTELSLKNNYNDVKGTEADDSTTIRLLGLTEKELFKRVENELDYLNHFKKIILNSIESKLTEQCEDIAKLYYCLEDTNSKLLSTKAFQLDQVLKRKLEDLRMSKICLIENQIQLGERITTYLKVMKEILKNLWNVIEEFKYHHELEKNKAFNDYFSGLVRSIVLKLKVLRLQATLNVYDKETIESLNIIRMKLVEEENEKNALMKNLNNQLTEYQIIGDEFDQIIQTYLDILKEIEITQDDISRIRQH
ncbi:17875_t:CDS:10 [Funneliformis geosporum]|uniref:17875_t:CDS:1 n=1 Tax=Funneliformis geosporum TaxID=1117311 RepID=A0A9W4WTY5_9GLOM|nr:17875_t:CDS:10 [Funneliformis geosporum]